MRRDVLRVVLIIAICCALLALAIICSGVPIG